MNDGNSSIYEYHTMDAAKEKQTQDLFAGLTPEIILQVAEDFLGYYLSNLCRPLNSYINRVYELEDEDGEGVIIKFYRPGRWSREAIQEEHDFLLELQDGEVPVIAPLSRKDGTTLGLHGDICFALFPKKGGRYVDELNHDQWEALGRLLGRAHMVGASKKSLHRPIIHPAHSTRSHLEYLRESGLIPREMEQEYATLVEGVIDLATPLFDQSEFIRIHADCHSGNLIFRFNEGYYLIDLDDMAMGPPVQDFWMLLPGDRYAAQAELYSLLEGYEMFRDFDDTSFQLIEPLRAMRFIHYSAWCAYQVKDDGHSAVVPDFGTRSYWSKEIKDLADQLHLMRTGGQQPLL